MGIPLTDDWWRLNNFLIHCCLISFAAWMKTRLLELIRECEALLGVRDVMLELNISQKEKALKDLDKAIQAKEESSALLTKQLQRVQKEYAQMSYIAEEA